MAKRIELLPQGLVNIEELSVFATAILKLRNTQTNFGHYVDFDHATIVYNAVDYHKRLFLEAWHSKRGQNAGNEHIEIPDFYVSLA